MPQVAKALFEIVRWCPLKEPHPLVPEKAINYLVKVGCDLERRNSEGLTPLLDAATRYQPKVIQCLNTYVKRGADINAIDVLGRGALHGALAVPQYFDHWKTLRLTGYIMFDILSYYYVPMCVFWHRTWRVCKRLRRCRTRSETTRTKTLGWKVDPSGKGMFRKVSELSYASSKIGSQVSQNDLWLDCAVWRVWMWNRFWWLCCQTYCSWGPVRAWWLGHTNTLSAKILPGLSTSSDILSKVLKTRLRFSSSSRCCEQTAIPTSSIMLEHHQATTQGETACGRSGIGPWRTLGSRTIVEVIAGSERWRLDGSQDLQRISVYYEDQPAALGLIVKGTTVPLNGTVFTEPLCQWSEKGRFWLFY